MKKNVVNMLLCTLVLLVASPSGYAQDNTKELKKDLTSRVEKDARKTAKTYEKEGWKVMPGKLPLERQIQDSRYAELEKDEQGKRVYLTGTHMATGGNYSAAKKIADSRAKTELAEQLNSRIDEIIKDNVSNNDYGDKDIEVIDKCISANKHLVSARLNEAIPVLEIFREGTNNTYEVQVFYKIEAKSAIKNTKMLYRTELSKESEELAKKLDELLP